MEFCKVGRSSSQTAPLPAKGKQQTYALALATCFSPQAPLARRRLLKCCTKPELYKCSDRSGPPSQGLCLKLQATDLDCEFLKSKSIFPNLILRILHPCAGSPEQGKHVAASSGARWRPEALCFKLAMNIGLTMRGCDQSPSLRLKT